MAREADVGGPGQCETPTGDTVEEVILVPETILQPHLVAAQLEEAADRKARDNLAHGLYHHFVGEYRILVKILFI